MVKSIYFLKPAWCGTHLAGLRPEIGLTARYRSHRLQAVVFTQVDLHREYHATRRNAAEGHRVPVLSVPGCADAAGPVGICQAITATRHILEMYRRQFGDEKLRRKLHHLDRRLLTVAKEIEKLAQAQK